MLYSTGYSPGFNIGWRSDVLVRESVSLVSPCAGYSESAS